MSKQEKIQTVLDDFGFEEELEMLEEYVYDSVCPAICMNEGCDYTAEYEPDCRSGHCEICDTPSCQSIMLLCGIM